MKALKLLLTICFIMVANATYNVAQSKTSNVEINTYIQQNEYKYIKTPTVYFINNSGSYSKANMNFTLVADAYGRLYIAYTNRYGVSYYNVQYSKNRDFKYTFYMNGWWFFN